MNAPTVVTRDEALAAAAAVYLDAKIRMETERQLAEAEALAVAS